MRVCLVASECAPLAKVGGLGDYAAALTRYLHRAGHDVRLFIPAHGVIDRTGRHIGPVDSLRDLTLAVGSRRFAFSVARCRLPGSAAEIYLVECPELFHRSSIYTNDAEDSLRFAFLTRATIESCQRMGWAPHVFHCNDWHTALLPVYLRAVYHWESLFAASRTLLTIHNVGYQGVVDEAVVQLIGLGEATAAIPGDDREAGRLNFLKTGVIHADGLSTVSPTHAREIQTETYGMGLDGLLRQRAARLEGILNGVDYEQWDPSRDRLIPFRYGLRDLRGKVHNKRALLRDVGLPHTGGTPLLGMVSRLVAQKGIDLMVEVLPEMVSRRRLRLAVLGSGEARYERFFETLRETFPDKVFFYHGYQEELAHRIEGASDIYLMPSLYEPCGLNQMYSLRYGAVPVVRRTGGLADTVEQFDPESGEGTGFVFESYSPQEFRRVVEQALDLYPRRPLWRRLMRNGMERDFSWERQVGRYEDLYRRLAG